MLKSMTGYGRAESKFNGNKIVVEIRSLNNRFLEFQFNCPKNFQYFENKIKQLIKKDISRGTINLAITIESTKNSNSFCILDTQKAKRYMACLAQIKKDFKMPEDIKIENLLSFPDIFVLKTPENESAVSWLFIKKAVQKVLDNLDKMRIKEGKNLEKDICKHLFQIENSMSYIEKRAPQRASIYRNNLEKKINAYLQKKDVDENRILTEIFLWIDKIDITEEITRIKNYIEFVKQTIKGKEKEKGKRLNFILQEMSREINTLGAKANDTVISYKSVNVKEEIEKIREQIQNIE